MPKKDRRNAPNQVLVRLTDEQDRLLRVAAALKRKSMSEIVGELIERHLSVFDTPDDAA